MQGYIFFAWQDRSPLRLSAPTVEGRQRLRSVGEAMAALIDRLGATIMPVTRAVAESVADA